MSIFAISKAFGGIKTAIGGAITAVKGWGPAIASAGKSALAFVKSSRVLIRVAGTTAIVLAAVAEQVVKVFRFFQDVQEENKVVDALEELNKIGAEVPPTLDEIVNATNNVGTSADNATDLVKRFITTLNQASKAQPVAATTPTVAPVAPAANPTQQLVFSSLQSAINITKFKRSYEDAKNSAGRSLLEIQRDHVKTAAISSVQVAFTATKYKTDYDRAKNSADNSLKQIQASHIQNAAIASLQTALTANKYKNSYDDARGDANKSLISIQRDHIRTAAIASLQAALTAVKYKNSYQRARESAEAAMLRIIKFTDEAAQSQLQLEASLNRVSSSFNQLGNALNRLSGDADTGLRKALALISKIAQAGALAAQIAKGVQQLSSGSGSGGGGGSVLNTIGTVAGIAGSIASIIALFHDPGNDLIAQFAGRAAAGASRLPAGRLRATQRQSALDFSNNFQEGYVREERSQLGRAEQAHQPQVIQNIIRVNDRTTQEFTNSINRLSNSGRVNFRG